jgi:hypothetical protein
MSNTNPEANQDKSPESEDQAEIVSAAELVNLIAYAGPGGRIKVRANYLPESISKVGWTSWRSEITKGPVVSFYKDPRTQDYITGILPLGGQTIFTHPPRVSSGRGAGDHRVVPFFMKGGTAMPKPYTYPIDPFTESNYQFEIIDRDEITPEEVLAIEMLEASEIPEL